MKFLLDTHTLIWYVQGNTSLSQKAYQLIDEPLNEIFVSMVSFYQIAIKLKIGKLELNTPLHKYFNNVISHNILVLPISEKYLSEYDNVPLISTHKDPFDRLIIATAITEKMSIITVDEQFSNYKDMVTLIW
ncbi:MAG TPA: type II toxin-antitoxin system VapC family toxin [Niabella sp.]|nr:type II toxin-antitoxin system VapC family toxin [Niabella sp.]